MCAVGGGVGRGVGRGLHGTHTFMSAWLCGAVCLCASRGE